MYGEIKLFGGNSNPQLAAAVATDLGHQLGGLRLERFSDGEIHLEIKETVRGHDVFFIQSLCDPVNDHLMELLIAVDAFRRSSAGRTTAVIPYYGYARQDRQVRPRQPITARLVADLLTAAGVDRVISMDLHSGQIQGFFSTPFDSLHSSPALLEAVMSLPGEDLVVVSPDAGGVDRARYYSQKLNAPLAVIDKRRAGPNQSEVMHVIGNVEGKRALIVDDMIDTAGTLTKGAKAVMEHGALEVRAMATHGVLSGPAHERILNSPLIEVFVTNTIPEASVLNPKLRYVPVNQILSEAIERVHGSLSVSSMFYALQ